MEAGLSTALESLWLDEADAVGETQEPIDHGDEWAWTGDNAKLLSAMAETGLVHGEEADAMQAFLLRMHDGPILYRRWANTHDGVVVTDDAEHLELSNHLTTLVLDRRTGLVDVQLEYHDGRDKRMAQMGGAQVLAAGAWHDAQPSPDVRVEPHGPGDAGGIALVRTLAWDGGSLTDRLWLSPGAGVVRSVRLDEGSEPIDGLRLPFTDLAVLNTDRPLESGHYRQAYLPGQGLASASTLARTPAPLDGGWLMLLDPARTDEFANGLVVRHEGGPALRSLAVTVNENRSRIQAANVESAGGGPGTTWTQRALLLDGVLTSDPAAYGPLSANVSRPGMAGVDPSLSYEVSETVLGLLHHAQATGDAASLAAARELFDGYLAFHARGTQTRSLAAGVQCALLLGELTGDGAWQRTALELAARLHTYQVTDDVPQRGAVVNEPGGGPFLDSTLAAANAWSELAEATGDKPSASWAQAAWGSLVADGDRIFIRGEESDDNAWSFKSGLALQGGPSMPEDLRWAARNHAWTVVRDLDSYQADTSRYARETNSETQAWVMLGLARDRAQEDGPWILDSEAPLQRLPDEEAGLRVRPPWPETRVWVEPGWMPFSDGVPSPRAPGPHGSWRYEVTGDVRFWPTSTVALPEGWTTLAWPGRDAPVEADSVLAGLPVDVAWSYDEAAGQWLHWRPGDGRNTLGALAPGAPVHLLLSEPAELEAVFSGDGTIPPSAPMSGPSTAPQAPVLVAGRLDGLRSHLWMGSVVEALDGAGRLLGSATVDAHGTYQLLVDAAAAQAGVTLVARAVDGGEVGRKSVTAGPGEVAVADFPSEPEPLPKPGIFLGLVILVASGIAVAVLYLALRFRAGSEPGPRPARRRT